MPARSLRVGPMQASTLETIRLKLLTNWIPVVETTVQHDLGQLPESEQVQEARISRFLKQVGLLMQDELQLMVLESMRSYLELLNLFAMPLVRVSRMRSSTHPNSNSNSWSDLSIIFTRTLTRSLILTFQHPSPLHIFYFDLPPTLILTPIHTRTLILTSSPQPHPRQKSYLHLPLAITPTHTLTRTCLPLLGCAAVPA